MGKIFSNIAIAVFFLLFFTKLEAASTQIRFYSQVLPIEYDPSLIIAEKPRCNDKSIVEFYDKLNDADYQSLLTALNKHRNFLNLNDWLYYELLRNSVNKIFQNKSELQKTLTTWFLLSKSGYDTRLTYLQNEAFVYVYTQDNLFEVPMIEERGRLYINLSSLNQKSNSYASEVFMLDFMANKNGSAFSFYLDHLPKLVSDIQERTFRFNWREQSFEINAKVDLTIIELMKKYPVIDEAKYLETPLSKPLAQSILPQLQKIIKDRSDKEALEILVAFTRSAFKYKEDHDYFGKSKPMIADEVFHYPYSDCEDRSALFYNLVKSLLDLPMIMVAYPDHLTIAVALSQPVGKPIRYNGKKYYICDPTGPSNSTEIGLVPKNYQSKSFEILASYK